MKNKILKGRYYILEKLGTGGTGQVFKIWDTVLEKEWALKTFIDSNEKMEKERSMELQVLKKISHPSFPRIVDVFEEEEKIYYVMDYVKGITLTEYRKQLDLSEEKILKVGIQIAEALLFLHQLSPPLLYLDLKPSNIIMGENEEIKIIDFGSVIIKGKRTGISGTPGYASPEQINLKEEGSRLNEQSDIYSLGMVLFSMVQKGDKALPMVGSGEKKGILVRKYQPVISRQTEKIIEKATRGDLDRRYLCMRDFLEDMKKSRERLRKKKSERIFQRKNHQCSPFWQQEKSILCCEGKSILYLFKVLFLCCLLIVYFQAPVQAAQKSPFKVVIRDSKGRKVLVKKNYPYEFSGNLYFEIPRENIDAEEFQIQINYLEEGKVVEEFVINCRKAKEEIRRIGGRFP